MRVPGALLTLLAGCELAFPLEDTPALTDCSRTDLIANDFADDSLVPWINVRATPRFDVVDGALAVDLLNGDAEVATQAYYDLRDSVFEVRQDRSRADPQGGPSLILALLPTPDRPVDAIAMRLIGEMLEVGTIPIGGPFTPLVTIPAQPDKPVWRIAHTGGEAKFFIADGDGSLEVASIAVDLSFVQPRLVGGTTSTIEPLRIAYDDVNGGVSVGRACSAVRLADDFTKPLDLQRWGRSSITNCNFAMGAGLELVSSGSNWSCTLASSTVHDLLAHRLELEFSDPVVTFPVNFGFEVSFTTPSQQRAGFKLLGDGRLESFVNTGGPSDTPLRTVPYDPASHRFWRFSADRNDLGETLAFETSADGVTYDSFLETGNLQGLGRLMFQLGAAGANPESTRLRINAITVTPPP